MKIKRKSMESGSSGLKEQAWQKSTLLPESAKPARKTPQRLHCLTAFSHSKAVRKPDALQECVTDQLGGSVLCVGGERKRGVLGSGAEGSCVIFSAGDREAAGDKESDLISALCKLCTASQLRRTRLIDTQPFPSTTCLQHCSASSQKKGLNKLCVHVDSSVLSGTR